MPTLEDTISQSLNGLWHYSTEDNPQFSNPGFDDSAWKTMEIPSNWFLNGLDHHGSVWFRHEFAFRKRREYASLQFDGVDYFSDVYLNGVHLGHHVGYFDSFSFDVTGILRSGKNILAVRVESPYETPGLNGWHLHKHLIKGVLNHHDCRPGGGWEPVGQSYNTGGIWNHVHLDQHGAITIDHLCLRAIMNTEPIILQAEIAIRNRIKKCSSRLEIHLVPENFKGKVQISKSTLDIPEGDSIHSLQIPVKDVHLWQPWDRGFPSLYDISARLILPKATVACSSLFGFRSIRVEPGYRWFINDKSYFPRGSNYLPSQWLSETLFSEAAGSKKHPFGGGPGIDVYYKDVALAKQANLNFLRVHAHVLPPEFHIECDRAGMLVWQDFPLQWGYSDDSEFQNEARRQMRAMITGLYNHPSIVAWCCHNESPWDAPWMAGKTGGRFDPEHNRSLDMELEAIARDLDPLRYIHRNSGTGDGHTYPGWYVGHWRDFQELPAAPFVTEYGAQGLPVLETILRMFPQFGQDAGFGELGRFKEWLDSQKKISPLTMTMIRFGTNLWKLMERKHWKSIQNWMKGWGIKIERSSYMNIPSSKQTPDDLLGARQVWETWRFHDFQPAETFDNGIALGSSLAGFISNSQEYQQQLIRFATECYRRAKYTKVTGLFQFDFTDPWPSVTWSVLDYWRSPKPAYDALRLCMQPVLPCFLLPENIVPGKAALISFCVVNDFDHSFPNATCDWRLESGMGDIAAASFPMDIPADGVSAETKLTLPSLIPGEYKLFAYLTSGGKIIGENFYDLTVRSLQLKKG